MKRTIHQEMLDHIPMLAAYLGADTRYKYINKNYLQWFQKAEHEIVGQLLCDVLGPRYYKNVEVYVEKVLAGVSSEFELPASTNGVVKTVKVKYVAHFDDDGKPNGFFIFVQDVSGANPLKKDDLISREQFGFLFDNLYEGIHLQDRDGKILRANSSFLKIMGITSEDALYNTLPAGGWQWVYEDLTPVRHEDRPSLVALKTGVTQHGQVLGFYKADASLTWLKITAVPMFPDQDGRFQQVLIAFNDVTEQKQTEQKMNDLSERRAISLAALRYGTWDLNLKTNALAWDDFMFNLFEVDKKDFKGNFEDFAKTLSADDLKRVSGEMTSAFENKASQFRSTFTLASKQGRPERHIAVCAQCIYDVSGQISRMVGANWDVTENVVRSRELESSQKLMRQIIDSTPDWIFVKDLDHRFLMVNKSFANAMGKTYQEIIGKNDLDMGIPEEYVKGNPDKSIRGFWADDDLIFKSGATIVVPDDLTTTAKGHVLHLHTVKAPLRNEKNEVFGVLGYSRDLTVMREKDRLLNDQQAKLQSASKMSALGEMAGGIAHEINTPLAIIVGQVGLLQHNLQQNEIHKDQLLADLDKIEKTTFRIAKIIKGLKSFSRNSDADPFEEVLFSQILDETLSLCLERFRYHNIELRTNIGDALLNCRATQISQVLMNLINNAHDAVENLADRWVAVDSFEEKDELVVHVTDSGSGIPKAIVQKMMNPFFTTKEVGKGTGLGLSISKGIIEEHGGSLTYDRHSNNTRFVIRLPLTTAKTLDAKKSG